jgi:aryl-alcohol dehydrogenase-like predicted oxidoreductase
MQTRRLGDSDLDITPLGFGAWAIGGPRWAWGWGPQDDATSIAAIHRALDRGINWIDTAAVYGDGHSEEVVARALDGMASRPHVFTKCGNVCDEHGEPHLILRAESIRREVEASLRRLRVDVIDLYQIHFPTEDLAEGWETMAALRREGKVRWIGVSNFSAAQLAQAQAIAPITSLQPQYSLVARDVEDAELPHCARHGIGVIAYSPLGSGLLSGAMTAARAAALPADDWRSREAEFQPPRLTRNLALVELLRAIGAAHGRGPAEVAIAWTLRRPEVTGAIVGARSPAQIDGWIGAADLRLSGDDLGRIDSFLASNP